MFAKRVKLVGVVGKQYQRGQASRTNGVAFGDGFGGVAHGVQRVGDVTHAFWHFRHFGNTTCVVGNRTIGVQRHHDAGHAEHGRCRNRDTVQAAQVESRPNRKADKQHWPGGGAHGNAQACNDVSAVARSRCLGDVLHWRVLGAGVVLGNPDQSGGQNQADGAGSEQVGAADDATVS